MANPSEDSDADRLRGAAFSLANEDKKRRQHHVWQHYLKSWTVDGRIYCLRDGRIFSTGTTTVAVERDFYKLHSLSSADIVLLKQLIIDNASPAAKKNHEEFLALLLAPAAFEGHLSEIDESIDRFRTNVLEDYNAAIEASFLPFLGRLLRGDADFYESDDDCVLFLHYISTQYMRTKNIRVRVLEGFKKSGGHDLTRIWNIMSHMFSVNIGMSLFLERRRRKLVLIENRTGGRFITGDQPVINLHANGIDPPECISLYYPISPLLALLLCEVDEEPKFTTDNLTSGHVRELNARIAGASHSQLFGLAAADFA